MRNNIYVYIMLMAVTSFIIRALPLTLIKKPITNKFIKSFLYYVPYVTLAVMTFPDIVNAAGTPLAGYLSLICGIIAAWFGMGLLPVAVICCVIVYVVNLL